MARPKLPANILPLRGHRRYESFDTFCVHVGNDFGVTCPYLFRGRRSRLAPGNKYVLLIIHGSLF